MHLFSRVGYERFPDIVSGEAQICLDGTFGSICDNSWDNDDASVICTQLGFSSSGMSFTTYQV